jgi:hypothetical protein
MPRRGAHDEDWEVHREEILGRYKKDDLKSMMAWMATQRGFERRLVILHDFGWNATNTETVKANTNE